MGFQKKTGKERLDKFYHLAKEQGYRSRASFKLVQLNRKFNFLQDARVVAAKQMRQPKTLIGVDLVPIKAIPKCTMLTQDITTAECRAEIKRVLQGDAVDVVLHDGAPNMGAAWLQDAYTQAELVLAALRLATSVLRAGGAFVSKVFRSRDYHNLLWVFNQFFKKVTATKPTASRNVSAEIFVVCEGYVAPSKIDPRLLDPRHIFKEVNDAPAQAHDIFKKKQPRRQREGYDTSGPLLGKRTSVLEFVHAADPVAVLGAYHELHFDADGDAAAAAELERYKALPITTDEVRACLADLKVLNANDYRRLLKWRQRVREGAQLGRYEPRDAPAPAPAPLTAEQRADLLEMDASGLLRAQERARKRRERKRLRQQQRARMRMGLNTNMADEEFELPTEAGLFTVNENVANDDDYNALLDEASDADSHSEFSDDVLELSDSDFEDTPAPALPAAPAEFEMNMPGPEDLFAGVESDDDSDAPRAVRAAPAAAAPPAKAAKAGADTRPAKAGTDTRPAEAKLVAKGTRAAADGAPPVKRRRLDSDALEAQEMEIVPAAPWLGDESESADASLSEYSDSDSDADTDLLDPTLAQAAPEEVAEVLALGKAMKNPVRRAKVLDSGINRFNMDFGSDVPDWFRTDESRHSVPLAPVTKEEIEEYKLQMKAVNARSSRKVLEAQARKKRKLAAKLDKAKAKARAISDNSEMTERDKLKAIQKLYKGQLDKVKRNKVYVVAGKVTKNKDKNGGNVRMKLVDARLKKDKRAMKRAADRSKKRKRS